MPLTKLKFRPGINREVTSYSNEGGWYDCDKVRFRFGFPEKIGGWRKFSSTTFLGTCRALHPWVALDGSRYLGVGTHLKYYINEGGGYSDITPIRTTTAAGEVTFGASANTLSADINTLQVTISLTSAAGFPPSGLIQIDSEQMRYTGVSGNDLTGVTRGVNGTSAVSHTTGTAVTCATLIVTDADHGALEGDFVTYSGAASLGSQITADVLNQEYEIVTILTSSTYLIEARAAGSIASITTPGGLAPTPVFADASDTGNGGASVVGAYQVSVGLDTTVVGNGWGAGSWGRGAWGSGANLATTGATLRIWSHDNFGEDLIFNIRDGGIYYWDASSGTTSRGVALSALSGSVSAPTIAKKVLVSDRDRHVLAFGCDSETNPGVQDPLLIRFSSQEDPTQWAALTTNTAGDLRIGSGSEIITAVETRQQIIVFTDVSLHAVQYVGAPFTFGVQMISENITMGGPMTAIAVDDQVFWMGLAEFYLYNGTVQRIPCPVRDYVFDDINTAQMSKITAGLNSEHGEIWWFYPSAASDENDRYVVYNYIEKVWYYGTMARTAWLDRGIEDLPTAASPDHFLYNHETGFDDGSTTPATAIAAYVNSSPIDLGDGEQFVFVRRMIPDVSFRNSTASTPSVNVTTRVRNFFGGPYLRTQEVTVTEDSEQLHLRLRGRQFGILVESEDAGVGWRLGSLRYDLQPDGKR